MKVSQLFHNKIVSLIFSFYILHAASCGANLHQATLDVALLNEPYLFYLSAEDESWRFFDQTTMVFSLTAGQLPPGITLGSNGQIAGSATLVGNYNFRVTAFAIDENFWHDDYVTRDSEWYTLFVTEPSTNDDCPLPNNRTLTGIFLCAGFIEAQNVSKETQINLDINYFVDLNRSKKYTIDQISFHLLYDSENFEPATNTLTSASLREAATRSGGTMQIEIIEPGDLLITIQGLNDSFHKAGRLLDIRFVVLNDLEDADYEFIIEDIILDSSNHDPNWPDPDAIQGLLSHTTTNSDLAFE